MKEMYVSLSGAVAQERHLAVLANNLANVNSVGFKREVAVFEVRPPDTRPDIMAQSADAELNLPPVRQMAADSRNYVQMTKTVVDFASGDLRPTGNSLDMALQERDPKKGVAFFAVETPEGERYTRMGNFTTNINQELVTPDGHLVKSREGSALKIPDQHIEVSPKGGIVSKGQEVGSLKVVVFDNPDQLEKIGNGLFSNGTAGSRELTDSDDITVRGGFVETSNVNIVTELVKMIEAQRAYTTYEKSIQAIDEISSSVINSVLNG